jgi:outer membrane protein assembly factor BamA
MRILLLALLLPLSAAAQGAPEVRDVSFGGVRAVEEAALRAVLETRASRCTAPLCLTGRTRAFLDTAALRRDEARVDSVYASLGFPRARMAAAVEPRGEGVAVRFTVDEGAPLRVRSVAVRGLEALPRPVAAPPLALREGDPYALPRLAESQRALARTAADQGFAFARVEVGGSISADQTEADVVLELVPGPRAVFGPTLVRAGAPLDERDVRGRLAYRVGDPFTPTALERTAERLYDLPIVRNVRLIPHPSAAADSVAEVEAVVEAGRAGAYGADFFVSASSCIGGTLSLASRYFLGAPREVSVSAGGANLFAGTLPCSRDAEGEFEEPSYFLRGSLREPVGEAGRLLLDAAFERETAVGAYVRRGARGRIGYARLLAPRTDGLISFAPERSDNEAAAPFFCGVRGACAGAALGSLTGVRTLAPLEVAVGWRSRGPARLAAGPRLDTVPGAAPPRGRSSARISVAGAGAPTGSELDFARALADASVTRFLGARTDVTARGRVGLLLGGDALPPHLRFYGGGPLGVRGSPANRLGPKLLVVREDDADALGCPLRTGACEGAAVDPDLVFVRSAGGDALGEATVEGRVWVASRLQLAAFVDVGVVHARGDGDSLLGSRTETLVTPGVGVVVVTPFAPLRLDVAYNPSPSRRYPLVARDPAGSGFIPLGNAIFDPFRGFRDRLQVQFSLVPGF